MTAVPTDPQEDVLSHVQEPERMSRQELYKRYRNAIIPVLTVDTEDNEHVGSAFHVGSGSFVTARHIAENQARCYIHIPRSYEDSLQVLDGSLYELESREMDIEIRFHKDPKIDIGCFQVSELSHLPAVDLGGHLDDWLSSDTFVLDDILVFGFPPIPLTQSLVLTVFSGQINAQVDLLTSPHVHFIVSVTARGGLSGGLVLHEAGWALGVVTSSLVKNNAPEELGYLTVLTIEPILQCLAFHNMMPPTVAEFWDGLFTSTTQHYGKPDRRWAQGWIKIDLHREQAIFEFACPSTAVIKACLDKVNEIFHHVGHDYAVMPVDVHQFRLVKEQHDLDSLIEYARIVVQSDFADAGFLYVESPAYHNRTLEEDSRFLDMIRF